MTAAAFADEATKTLLVILDGLVALQMLRLSDPAELARVQHKAMADALAPVPIEADDDPGTYGLADIIAGYGDRLINPASFRPKALRVERARLLSAMATALALGATSPGGVTWCGRHWCTDHASCLASAAGGPQ